ncbi:MAG: hypothetical protein WD249_10235 [Gaiellaceae bacterium]
MRTRLPPFSTNCLSSAPQRWTSAADLRERSTGGPAYSFENAISSRSGGAVPAQLTIRAR